MRSLVRKVKPTYKSNKEKRRKRMIRNIDPETHERLLEEGLQKHKNVYQELADQ